MNLSKSRILCYLNCPLHFKYKYIFDLKEPGNKWSDRGIRIHDTLNEFFSVVDKTYDILSLELCDNKTVDDFTKEFNETLKFIDSEKYEEFKLFYNNFAEMEASRLFLTREKQIPFMPLHREVRIDKNGLTGIIDRIDHLEDGTYMVLDYKTEKIPVRDKQKAMEKFMLELPLYAKMTYDEFGLEVSSVGIIGLQNKVILEKKLEEEDIQKAMNIVDYVQHEIQQQHFDKAEKPDCFFCGFKDACARGGK